MNEKMKGVFKLHDAPNGWAVQELDREDPGPDEVEMEVMAAGICGSELHLYHDNHWYTPGTVIGHEFSGRISRVGSNVTKWKVGDRVISENYKDVCMTCEDCKVGRFVFCKYKHGAVGYDKHGGWRQYHLTEQKLLMPIPENVTYEEAAMTEPSSVVIQALCIKAPVKAGETVLVMGCGTIGLLAAMTAKAAGASKVIITGTDSDEALRLKIARELEMIDIVYNVNQVDIVKEIMEMTDNIGVDMVVDCSGSDIAINQAISLCRRAGRIVALGETKNKEISFRWTDAVIRDVTIYYSFASMHEAWKLALQFISEKKLYLKPLITHRLELDDFEEGFHLLDRQEAVKVMLIPNPDDVE